MKKNNFSSHSFESRFNIKYQDQTQNFNGNGKLRILKDSIIWGSINFMGIPVVKFYLTPTQVKYYNKIEKTYYEGDYKKIKQIAGAPLDFYHIQNLLLGNTLYPPSSLKDYKISIRPGYYQLENPSDVLTLIKMNPDYKVTKEILIPQPDLKVEIDYDDFKEVNKELLPHKLYLHSRKFSGETKLSINYKNINLNKDLHFPFSIPSQYTKINF